MKMSVSKKVEKVIKEGLEELMQGPSLREVTTIGSRMILRVAVEEELTAYLQRDYYERNTGARKESSERVRERVYFIVTPHLMNAEGHISCGNAKKEPLPFSCSPTLTTAQALCFETVENFIQQGVNSLFSLDSPLFTLSTML